MTKLIQQLAFSNSNNFSDGTLIEPDAPKGLKKFYGDGASLNAPSKRSALSSSDAECFSLCLGAGPLCGSAPPGGVNSGASSPAIPSTPTHDDNNHDLLSALLWTSSSSLSSDDSLQSPRAFPGDSREVVEKILSIKDVKPVKIDFKIFLTENTVTRWEAVVQGNTIYLRMPGVLQSGSKESFMLLLDFAEESLGSKHCIICVLKSRPDRATLLRTFMFMGFTLLPPGSNLLQGLDNPEYMFLHYNMQ